MKQFFKWIMGTRVRKVTAIASAIAVALTLTTVSVASAHGFSQHRPNASSASKQWTDWKKHHRYSATKPGSGTGGSATPTPKPTPTATTTPTPTPTKTSTPSPTKSPTPTPTSTPTTPPTTAPTPTTGAWPDASNTGVPAGVTLTPTGGMTITKAGTVVSGMDINGDVVVRAANVTIENSKVHGRIDTSDSGAAPNTMIKRVEIIGPYNGAKDSGSPAVGYTGFTCDGCVVHGWGKGFGLVKDVTIKNSWVYDIVVYGDPANGGSHNEAILSLGGTNLTVTNNRLDAGDAPNVSASLALYSQMAAFNNVLVQGNLFDGGGYCVYAGLGGSYGASNTRFVDNTFGDKYDKKCGGYGPAIAYSTGNGNQWTGNVLESSGAVVGTPGRG